MNGVVVFKDKGAFPAPLSTVDKEAGSDAAVDEAIRYYPKIEAFLAQDKNERSDLASGYRALGEILDMAPPAAPAAPSDEPS